MKLSEIKKHLHSIGAVNFQLQNGILVPPHFHVTEVGIVTKQFIDCGGTMRNERTINFQLWSTDDLAHRLTPQKLLSIIELSEKALGISMYDLETEVEYQPYNNTIGKYDVAFNGKNFILIHKQTNCLATDKCGISPQNIPENSCKPNPNGGRCC